MTSSQKLVLCTLVAAAATRQSETARFLTYDAGAANPFASSVARTGR